MFNGAVVNVLLKQDNLCSSTVLQYCSTTVTTSPLRYWGISLRRVALISSVSGVPYNSAPNAIQLSSLCLIALCAADAILGLPPVNDGTKDTKSMIHECISLEQDSHNQCSVFSLVI